MIKKLFYFHIRNILTLFGYLTYLRVLYLQRFGVNRIQGRKITTRCLSRDHRLLHIGVGGQDLADFIVSQHAARRRRQAGIVTRTVDRPFGQQELRRAHKFTMVRQLRRPERGPNKIIYVRAVTLLQILARHKITDKFTDPPRAPVDGRIGPRVFTEKFLSCWAGASTFSAAYNPHFIVCNARDKQFSHGFRKRVVFFFIVKCTLHATNTI
jgi:hypothetical protein